MNVGEIYVAVSDIYKMWSNEILNNNIHHVGKHAAKDRVSFAHSPPQGQWFEGKGIEPIHAPGEVARFPRSSTDSHLKKYFETMGVLDKEEFLSNMVQLECTD